MINCFDARDTNDVSDYSFLNIIEQSTSLEILPGTEEVRVVAFYIAVYAYQGVRVMGLTLRVDKPESRIHALEP